VLASVKDTNCARAKLEHPANGRTPVQELARPRQAPLLPRGRRPTGQCHPL